MNGGRSGARLVGLVHWLGIVSMGRLLFKTIRCDKDAVVVLCLRAARFWPACGNDPGNQNFDWVVTDIIEHFPHSPLLSKNIRNTSTSREVYAWKFEKMRDEISFSLYPQAL